MSKKKNMTAGLITSASFDDEFGGFTSDRERLKYMKEAYGKMSIAKAFETYYSMNITPSVKQNKAINIITTISVGEIYLAEVKSISKDGTVFYIPGVKEEIRSKETFSDCREYVDNYLLTHDNKVSIEIREKKNNTYYCSVMNAYYRLWQNMIEKAILHKDGINVHIDSLVKGGYICHTSISTINELTGKNYTSSVFIPGSQIVLNIEHDFERWVGKDVMLVPNKFAKFRNGQTVENSIVGSRKQVLVIQGMVNMYNIWSRAQLASNPTVKYTPETFEGTVTGIINSNKKTGVFIELEDLYITGLLPVDQADLLTYKPGDKINVAVKEFECQEGQDPFIVNKMNKIVKCNIRPVFQIA